MSTALWGTPINDTTPEEDLHKSVMEAARSSDAKVLRQASLAQAELNRRERKEWVDRFSVERRARVKVQEFQAAQMQMLLEVATQQARAAQGAKRAAWAAAIAAIAVAILSVLATFGILTGLAEIFAGASGGAS
jgi:hypothetical protein